MSLQAVEAPGDGLLRVSEIFCSLQGETSRVGLPTVFVRLTGCPLRCRWCDTAYAFSGGTRHTVEAVLAQMAVFPVRRACVTGGEPLAQRGCLDLLRSLCDAGWEVSLETSGALGIGEVDPRVSRVLDIKAPGSGEEARNHWENLQKLNASDEIKIVIASREDYLWAVDLLKTRDLSSLCSVLFSPVAGEMEPRDLADWIVADALDVRFQLPLHKTLWGQMPGK